MRITYVLSIGAIHGLVKDFLENRNEYSAGRAALLFVNEREGEAMRSRSEAIERKEVPSNLQSASRPSRRSPREGGK